MSTLAPPSEAVSVIAQEFLVDAPCAIAVDVPGAQVHMHPGQDPDRVEVNVSVAGCLPEEAESVLDRMSVGTRQMKDLIRVYSDADRTDAEWWRWVRTLDVDLHVELRLPPQVDAEVTASGGSIQVADLEGRIDLRVTGGQCSARDLTGTVSIEADSSDVSVQRVSGEQLSARVSVGSLTLEDVQSDTVTVQSTSAPLSLTNVSGSVEVTANSASVDLRGVPGPCMARVEAGALTYEGPPSTEVDLRVIGDALTAALPSDHGATLSMVGPTLHLDDAFSFSGERTRTAIDGQLNDGGPSLHLQSTGGSVYCQSDDA